MNDVYLDRLFALRKKHYKTEVEEFELKMLEEGYKEYKIDKCFEITKMNLAEQMYQKTCGIPQLILDKINEEAGLGKTSFYLNNIIDIKLYDCIRDNQSKLEKEGFKIEKGMMGIAISWNKSEESDD